MARPIHRELRFRTAWAKARWLDAAASADALHPLVCDVAHRFCIVHVDPEPIAHALFRFVRDGIRYVRDPGHEQFTDTATMLRRGAEDCDGKARALVALCRAAPVVSRHARGLLSRILPVFRGRDFVHVQAHLWWPRSFLHPLAEPDGWLLAELTLRDVELGQGSEAARRDARGKPIVT